MPLPVIGAVLARGAAALGGFVARIGGAVANTAKTAATGISQGAKHVGSWMTGGSPTVPPKPPAPKPPGGGSSWLKTISRAMQHGERHQPEETRKQRIADLRMMVSGFQNFGGARQQWRDGNPVGALAQATKGTAQVVGAAAKLNPNAATAVAGAPAMMLSLAAMPRLLKDFGDGLIEGKRSLAELNGGLAASFAQLRGERHGRDIRIAGMTSGTLSKTTKSQSRLEESLLPFQAAGENLKNHITSALQDAASFVLEGFAKVPVLGALLEYLANEKAKNGVAGNLGPLGDLSKWIADGKFKSGQKFTPLPKNGK